MSTVPSISPTTELDVRVWQLWGKADPKRKDLGPEWHPLLCHVLDVVACAKVLLTDLYPRRLASYASAFGVSEEHGLAWILFVVALHDLGKATPPFQAKVPLRMEELRGLGLDFPDGDEPHGSMSAVLVPDQLERFGCPRRLARGMAAAVGAHHGDFATTEKLNNLEDDLGKNAGRVPLWASLRRSMVDSIATITGVVGSSPPGNPSPASLRQGLLADLAGLTTVADWIGSNADVFNYVEPPPTTESYFALALARASTSLSQAGFRRPPRPGARSFKALFDRTPWPLHDAVLRVLDDVGPGSLVIVEAPMGEGKTEAALLLYDTLASRRAQGLYFALPTQATANQILGRVDRYLSRSFPGEAHGLHLVHGGAGLSDRYGELKRRAAFSTRSIGDVSRADGDQGPIADAWFARSKRALLAPIAVGTVDQALLGVLRSKHHFLRLHGLAGKVFVVDEVHAYETFTAEILSRLCAWLRSLGSTVVLLSATLASPQRARILQSYGVTEPPPPAPYPRITVARDGQLRAISFEARRPPIEIAIEWKESVDLPCAVAEAVRGGGCVAWIVNTVARAQTIYSALGAMRARGELGVDVELSLLHARFPFAARQERERAAEDAFGPPDSSDKRRKRPHAAVLIGTQVLEQSLDLDFDLMVTDLAPVDLVLQRAGRLHRHDRAHRPPGLSTRRLWIARPESLDAPTGPTFGSSSFVYDESVLLRSWLALASRARVILPTDIEPLVEAVYAPTNEAGIAAPVAARLAEVDAERENQERRDSANADRRELPGPAEANPFGAFSVRFDDEDPRVHSMLRAITRLGEETVTVVPVIRRGGRLVLASDPSQEVATGNDELAFGDVIAIARHALSIGRKAVVFALLRDQCPPCFQRSGHLRHHRLLHLNEAGEAVVGGTRLHLDPELGLVVGDPQQLAEPT
jgi:CRISPR-associated endonuclease/helicase Cas3